MATKKTKADLAAIFKLEFYRKQSYWKFHGKTKKEETKVVTKPCAAPTLDKPDVKCLNKTYNVEPAEEGERSVLNEAFMDSDNDKNISTPQNSPICSDKIWSPKFNKTSDKWSPLSQLDEVPKQNTLTSPDKPDDTSPERESLKLDINLPNQNWAQNQEYVIVDQDCLEGKKMQNWAYHTSDDTNPERESAKLDRNLPNQNWAQNQEYGIVDQDCLEDKKMQNWAYQTPVDTNPEREFPKLDINLPNQNWAQHQEYRIVDQDCLEDKKKQNWAYQTKDNWLVEMNKCLENDQITHQEYNELNWLQQTITKYRQDCMIDKTNQVYQQNDINWPENTKECPQQESKIMHSWANIALNQQNQSKENYLEVNNNNPKSYTDWTSVKKLPEPIFQNWQTWKDMSQNTLNILQYSSDMAQISVNMPPISSNPQFSPNMPQISPNMPQISPNMPQISPIIPQISPNMPQISPNMPHISPIVPQISPIIPQISPNMPQISTNMPQISPNMPQISPNIPQNLPSTPLIWVENIWQNNMMWQECQGSDLPEMDKEGYEGTEAGWPLETQIWTNNKLSPEAIWSDDVLRELEVLNDQELDPEIQVAGEKWVPPERLLQWMLANKECCDDLLESSSESEEQFMRAAHCAPHSTVIDLQPQLDAIDTSAECLELATVAADAVCALSESALRAIGRAHQQALRRVADELRTRERQRSRSSSHPLPSPQYDISCEEYPTRDIGLHQPTFIDTFISGSYKNNPNYKNLDLKIDKEEEPKQSVKGPRIILDRGQIRVSHSSGLEGQSGVYGSQFGLDRGQTGLDCALEKGRSGLNYDQGETGQNYRQNVQKCGQTDLDRDLSNLERGQAGLDWGQIGQTDLNRGQIGLEYGQMGLNKDQKGLGWVQMDLEIGQKDFIPGQIGPDKCQIGLASGQPDSFGDYYLIGRGRGRLPIKDYQIMVGKGRGRI